MTIFHQGLDQGRRWARSCVLVSLACAALSGCFHDDDDDNGNTETQVRYEIQVTNLTYGQPLSPSSMILHSTGFQAFEVGQPASEAVERLAESGDNTMLLSQAEADDNVWQTGSGDAPLAPGATVTYDITAMVSDTGSLRMSVLSMLGNTNDGIASVRNIDVSDLAVDEQRRWTGNSYDAGTEANDESADTIPGPAAAGGEQEGFNSARNDVADQVVMHSGVVTASDGLAGSVLTDVNRWDNPVMQVAITRVE